MRPIRSRLKDACEVDSGFMRTTHSLEKVSGLTLPPQVGGEQQKGIRQQEVKVHGQRRVRLPAGAVFQAGFFQKLPDRFQVVGARVQPVLAGRFNAANEPRPAKRPSSIAPRRPILPQGIEIEAARQPADQLASADHPVFGLRAVILARIMEAKPSSSAARARPPAPAPGCTQKHRGNDPLPRPVMKNRARPYWAFAGSLAFSP